MLKGKKCPIAQLIADRRAPSSAKLLSAFFLAAVIFSSLLAGTACGSAEDSSVPMASPDLTALEIIDMCADAMDEVDSFHLELTHSGGGTPAAWGLEVTNVKCDVSSPDRLKGTIEAMWASSYVELQLVTVGNSFYMTNPLTGNWEQVSTKFDAAGLFDLKTNFGVMVRAMANPTRTNDQKVAGLGCYHVEGEMASEDLYPIVLLLRLTPAEGAIVDAEMWVGQEDNLLHRIRFKGQLTADEEPDITRTMTLSMFGQEVEIELPE